MSNKIFKIGHSSAITLSPKILEALRLKVGVVFSYPHISINQ